jgi:hypothetical protein
MRNACERFFAERFPLTGLVACGARLPDGMVIHQCYNRWLNPQQVRQSLTHLAQGFDFARQHQFEPGRMVWVFEHLRVHLGLGPGNACLALFLENRPDLPSGEIQRALEEFAKLSKD